MFKGPYGFQLNTSRKQWEVVDSSQVIAVVSTDLPGVCQETAAKVIALALNAKFPQQK